MNALGVSLVDDPTLHHRFAAKIDYGSFLGCWIWNGASTEVRSAGYRFGVIRAFGRTQKASRVSWMLNRSPIPYGINVCHCCDNPMCVNPGHLFLGTQADNVADMDKKGRRVTAAISGVSHHNARLTSDQVTEVQAFTGPARILAARFGVSDTTIRNIRRGLVRRNG